MKKHFEMWRKGSLLLLAITFALVAGKAHASIDGLGVWEPAAAAWRFSDSPTAPSIDHTAAGFGLGNPNGTPSLRGTRVSPLN